MRPRGAFLPGSVKRELEQELEFHFACVVEDLMRAGETREAAEGEARRRFGDETKYRRELERIDHGIRRRRRWIDRWIALERNMKYALRTLSRSPALSFGVVLAFALGIGANATMFGIVDRLLLSPPAHIADPDNVHRLAIDRTAGYNSRRVQTTTISWDDYVDFTKVEQFAGVAAYLGRGVMLGRGEQAEPANATMVTGNFFELLGATPVIGRFFGDEEDRQGAEGVAVIGHALWKSRFGGTQSVLGQTMDFGYGEYTIIGVAPKGFTGIGLQRVDIWAPMQTAGRAAMGDVWFDSGRDYFFARAVARLASGVTLPVAEEAATAVHRVGRNEEIRSEEYDASARVFGASIIVARSEVGGGGGSVQGGVVTARRSSSASVALWLAGVSAVVLLIACVNVANLLVARAIRQQRDIGIRLAIGITRGQLMRQTLTEGLILAGLGGAAALIVSRWGGDIVRGILLPNVEFVASSLVWRTIPIVIVLSILAGVLAALVPALETGRRDVAETLRITSGGITRSALRVRGILSTVQAALSVLLLVGAGLFVRSLHNVRSLDLGFNMEDLLVATLVEDGAGLPRAEKVRFFDEAVARVGSFPGVQSVSYSVASPFLMSWAADLRIPGRDSLPRANTGGPYMNAVSRNYLETMDLRLLRGRGFEDGDFVPGQFIVLVNQAMVDLYWPSEDPIGSCLQIDSYDDGRTNIPCSTVVGVVETARRGSVIEEPNPQYYVPFTHEGVSGSPYILMIRVPRASTTMIPAIRQTLLALEPRLRFVRVQPMEDFTTGELRSWRLGATMFTVFGLLALVVAAIGLYSVLAFDVAQRRREIGLRSALGAGTPRLVRIVVASAMRMTVAGLAVGLVLAMVLAPRLGSMLFETSPRDPLTLATVSIILLVVALIASGFPAWRAARVDPNITLRSD